MPPRSLFFGPSPASLVDPDPAFQKLEGKWIVAPVAETLVYKSDRVQPELKRWVDDVAAWDFTFVAPSHFDAKPGTPKDFKAAFASTLGAESSTRPYGDADARLLDGISSTLSSLGVI